MNTSQTKVRRVALACQGGGSHTAFTTGVLKTLLTHMHDDPRYQVVALSGTSGGAMGALVAWYGMLRQAAGHETIAQTVERIRAFWDDNAAHSPMERMMNASMVSTIRLQGRGLLPSLSISPYNPIYAAMMAQSAAMAPRKEFVDFPRLIQKHVNFDELDSLIQPTSPRLLLGAVDVIEGTFKAFDSKQREISLEALLASAAIPMMVPAVQVGESYYWDGLFSQNPPIREFFEGIENVQEKPDEIWVIRISPRRYPHEREPQNIGDIMDRLTQLSGNLSLYQEKSFIESWNEFVVRMKESEESALVLYDVLTKIRNRKYVEWREIEISHDIIRDLDFASAADRDEDFINRLIADGERQATRFWQTLTAPAG